MLEFLYKHSYDESDSRGSCSFAFCTSSNIDQKISSLKESIIFAELYLELSYKDWTKKLEKMNRYAEEENVEYPRKSIKLFIPSKFLTGYAIIIGALYYSSSSAALFSEGKDQEDSWDTVT